VRLSCFERIPPFPPLTPRPRRAHDCAMSTALIVIDVQEEYFSGRLPIEFPPRESSLEMITTAMDQATAASVPVVLVRHNGEPGGRSFQPDSPTWKLRAEVADRHHDLVIDKRLPGSFTGTDLEQWLGERAIDHITIVGYMTNVCCDTTARQAIHLGLGATLLHDAVGVPVMPDLDGNPVNAEALQRAALAPLALMGVELTSTAHWIQTLAPGPRSDA
jgi:nicotinamidase-related amidase